MGDHKIIRSWRVAHDGQKQELLRLVCSCGYAVSHADQEAQRIMKRHLTKDTTP